MNVKVLILILLILILYYMTIQYKELLVNDDRYINYRLSDIIREWSSAGKGTPYRKNFIKNFPGTLGAMYLMENKKTRDFRTLNRIIKKHFLPKMKDLPDNKTLIVHLRIGDTILNKKEKVKGKDYHKYDLLIEPWFTYAFQPSKYEKLADKFDKSFKVIIIYGAHFKQNVKISRDYINDIKNVFKKKGFSVSEKISGNPDLDFSYMCESKHFVKGGGGYSNLIADNVRFKGNIVYEFKK